MRLIPRQKIWLTVVVAANLVLWVVPSNVVENIARDHHTLLGRYSLQHFTLILGVLLISMMSIYIDWGLGKNYRQRWFQVLTAVFAMVPPLALADFLLRSADDAHYVRESTAYHRPPNFKFGRGETHVPREALLDMPDAIFADKPKAHRSYPGAPPGYPPIEITYTADARGFRNQTDLGQYDVVVLGDSFAEGSGVSDEHPWPHRLAKLSGLSVYNLGMSGYAPMHYLASLKEYGLGLKPKRVICMLYEGNDFRSAKADQKELDPSFSKQAETYFKQSPILSRLDLAIINTFGPIRSGASVPGGDILSWLPLKIPEGPGGKHYAFAPKQVLSLLQTKEQFRLDKHWFHPRSMLEEMRDLCTKNGAELIVVYAPNKAHVMLPPHLDDLSPEQLHAFCALREDELPEPAALMDRLRESLDGQKLVVGEWCAKESIRFLSLTEPLRTAALTGQQVYFTYDQHWTPPGHEVVAAALDELLEGIKPADSHGGEAPGEIVPDILGALDKGSGPRDGVFPPAAGPIARSAPPEARRPAPPL